MKPNNQNFEKFSFFPRALVEYYVRQSHKAESIPYLPTDVPIFTYRYLAVCMLISFWPKHDIKQNALFITFANLLADCFPPLLAVFFIPRGVCPICLSISTSV